MPRPDRPLTPDADPVQRLAWDLRQLRDQAGGPTYQALARRTQSGPEPRSSTTLSDAAGGQTCPSWTTLAAFVTACGGTPAEWRDRWQQAQSWQPGHDTPSQADTDHQESDQSPQRNDDRFPGDPLPTSGVPSEHHVADAAQEPPVDPVSIRRRSRWPDRRLVLIGSGVVTAAAVLGTAGLLWNAGSTVAGTVTCADGGAVVGVWVKADEESRSGYASYLQSTDPAHADFQYRLSKGSRWTVNVGCGGTTQNWLHQVHGVMMTSATQQNWTCDSDLTHYGCRTTP